MPTALTLDEKVARAEKKAAEKAANPNATKRKRNTFNGTEAKLKVMGELNTTEYHYHIFNDEPGRIDQAIAVGYEFCSNEEVGGTATNVVSRNTDIGDKVRFLVGTDTEGKALYAYLMKIKLEFYEEDQAALQARNDLIDEAIRGGKITKDGHNTEGFYTPREGIKYRT